MMHTTSITILIIEDDEPKLKSIHSLISENFQTATILIARSLSSAISELSKSAIDLAIVDMSLPTYDFAIDRAGGGDPQGFGGSDILRFMESECPDSRALVLTQHEEFPGSEGKTGKHLSDLSNELTEEFGELFIGLIYYSGRMGEWREKVITAIKLSGKFNG